LSPAELGKAVAKMPRIDFPDEIEKFLLKAVTDQFASGLRGARLKNRQERKRNQDVADLTMTDNSIKEIAKPHSAQTELAERER
jgi:hypothetical protein